MSSRPVIGIITNVDHDPHYLFAGHRRLTSNEDYARSVAAAGGVPILVPALPDTSMLAQQLDLLDGLLLAGGPDVAPLLYGQAPKQECQTPSPIRDAFEMEALRIARTRGLPVFGICRGMQLINVFLGGTLFQDLRYAGTDHQHMALGNPAEPLHLVDVAAGSFLDEAWGRHEQVAVNSFHHQVIDRVADHLDVVARATDGVVEAVEYRGDDFELAAVQWHPEMMTGSDARSQQLFAWVVERMAASSTRAVR